MEWRKEKRGSSEVLSLKGDQFFQLPDVYCIDDIPVAPNSFSSAPTLSSNYDYARNRLARLKKRLETNADLKQKYVNALNDYITKGFAREWNQTSEEDNEFRC